MTDEIKDTLEGHAIALSEDRQVFVAKKDDTFYIRFRNADGDYTHLKLSEEGAQALHRLLSLHPMSDPVMRFAMEFKLETKTLDMDSPVQYEWKQVEPDADD